MNMETIPSVDLKEMSEDEVTRLNLMNPELVFDGKLFRIVGVPILVNAENTQIHFWDELTYEILLTYDKNTDSFRNESPQVSYKSFSSFYPELLREFSELLNSDNNQSSSIE